MQIFGIILKAFLEHLSGKFEPKPETFVKFDMFDTIFNPFWTQNVEHSTKSGVRAERREAARRGRGAKFDECFRKSASKGARAWWGETEKKTDSIGENQAASQSAGSW